MIEPPEPEPKGSLVPPTRRPPTAVAAGLRPPDEGSRGPLPSHPRSSRPWLLRALDGAFWLLDRVGEDLARALGVRRLS
jgi:hypothetical protein